MSNSQKHNNQVVTDKYPIKLIKERKSQLGIKYKLKILKQKIIDYSYFLL
jgi:hypothetical protein